jgi:hypothetical protein
MRKHLRFGTWCALFALLTQFAASFGHAHRIDAAAHPSNARQLAFQALAAGIWEVPPPPALPAGSPFDYCEICAATSLAGSGLLLSAPQLHIAIIIQRIHFWLKGDAATVASPIAAFRARAPPHA